MDFSDKVALVLGATKGIGKGVSLALAQAGVKVALNHYEGQTDRESLEKEIARTGAQHLIVQTDLLDADKIPGLIQKVINRFGRLDILINNIERGGWPIVHGPYLQGQWDLEMATTLRAKRWVFDHALPHLQASGDGIVINFSSIAAIVGRSGPASLIFNEGYAAANRGISLLTETWARLGAPQVRVNEIMLGFFETRHAARTRGWRLLTAAQKTALREHTLLKRTGTVADVVKAVLFIIKDAPFMTGAVLRLDGGYVLGGAKIAPMPPGVL